MTGLLRQNEKGRIWAKWHRGSNGEPLLRLSPNYILEAWRRIRRSVFSLRLPHRHMHACHHEDLISFSIHHYLLQSSSMRAYYYDNLPGDQRLPHDCVPSRPVSAENLAALGVKFWTVPVEGYEAKIDAIAKEQGYKNRDTMHCSKEGLGEVRGWWYATVSVGIWLMRARQIYEQKIKTFFEEWVKIFFCYDHFITS